MSKTRWESSKSLENRKSKNYYVIIVWMRTSLLPPKARRRRKRKSTSISLFAICLLEVRWYHSHEIHKNRKDKETSRFLKNETRIRQTIFWIAILSSASATSDINQTRQYLLREQSNHTQSLILKNDWTESLKQFLEPDQKPYYLLEKLLVIENRKELFIPQTQFQSKLQLLFDYLIGTLVVPKKKRKKRDFAFDIEREIWKKKWDYNYYDNKNDFSQVPCLRITLLQCMQRACFVSGHLHIRHRSRSTYVRNLAGRCIERTVLVSSWNRLSWCERSSLRLSKLKTRRPWWHLRVSKFRLGNPNVNSRLRRMLESPIRIFGTRNFNSQVQRNLDVSSPWTTCG